MANYKDKHKIPSKPLDQRISLSRAIDLTKRHQRSSPASEKAGFFFLASLKDLLAQPGVYGLRVYHGLDEKGRYRMVLVGVDQDGNDIVRTRKVLKSGAVARATGDAILLDGHLPCPPFCAPNSPL